MTNDEMKFEYLLIRYKYFCISSFLDIPILIVMWYLGYETGFWLFLFITIICNLGFLCYTNRVEEELGIKQ